MLREVLHQRGNGLRFLQFGVEIRLKHLNESPLRPAVVVGVAGAYLAVPVVAEAYLVELLAVAGNVALGGDGGVLPRLYGILLGGQAKGIVAHGMQHVEAVLAFVA